MTVMSDNRILRLAQVLERVGISKSTLYKMIAHGEFPRAIQLGQRSTGWLHEEVDVWLESRPHTQPRTGPQAG